MAKAKPSAAQVPPETGVSPPDPRKSATRIRAAALLAALKDVAGLVEARSTIPVLAHVMVEAIANQGGKGGRIVLTASNLDVWAVRDLASDDGGNPDSRDWQGSTRNFAVLLPGKPLLALIGEFDPAALVVLEVDEAARRATLSAGRARFTLNALPVADFPLPPIVEPGASFELPCSQLADSFAAVEHAISTEETRYYLNGVFLHPCQNELGGLDLRVVATDGHRLAQLSLDAPASLGDPGGAARFPCAIVGSATVGLLDKLCASAIKAAGAKEHEGAAPPRVEIAAASDARLIRWAMPCGDGGTIVVTAKTVDGEYPDYTRVVPAAPPLRALIARGPLAEAVKRVAVLVDHKTHAVKACFAADFLILTVTTAGLGEGREEVPCSYQGPEVTLGLNSRYWRDALGALATDTVAMGFAEDPQAAVLLRGWGDAGEESDRIVQVLMPMRV